MDIGKLKHKAYFIENKYISLSDGTGKQESVRIKTVCCSLADVSWQRENQNKTHDGKRTVKMTTRYFSNASLKYTVMLDNSLSVYKIMSIEDVDFKRESLIFTLVEV